VGRHERASEYPHEVRESVRREVIKRHTDEAGNVIDPVTGEVIPPEQVTLDHIEPVVEHWNTRGYNMTRAERTRWFNEPENLRVAPQPRNSAEGAMMPTYRQDVGTGYTLD
jgi:hypothetical protein